MKELENKPGFFIVPDDHRIVVNAKGDVFHLRLDRFLPKQKHDQGYEMVAMTPISGMINHPLVHRLVAKAMIPIPEKFEGMTFDDLEVNHIDGVKNNNNIDNLEWVTPKDNINHSYDNDLHTATKVLSRDVHSGEITHHRSMAALCAAFDIDVMSLKRRLRSRKAGTLTKNNCVFKLDDGSDWDIIPAICFQEPNLWDMCAGGWVIKNLETEVVYIADTLEKVAQLTGYTKLQIAYQRNELGNDQIGNWIITYDEFGDATKLKEKIKIREPIKIKVTNSDSKEVSIHDSQKKAAVALGIHEDNIRYALKAKNGVYKNFLFEKV